MWVVAGYWCYIRNVTVQYEMCILADKPMHVRLLCVKLAGHPEGCYCDLY